MYRCAETMTVDHLCICKYADKVPKDRLHRGAGTLADTASEDHMRRRADTVALDTLIYSRRHITRGPYVVLYRCAGTVADRYADTVSEDHMYSCADILSFDDIYIYTRHITRGLYLQYTCMHT
jgi:hypothetical protein